MCLPQVSEELKSIKESGKKVADPADKKSEVCGKSTKVKDSDGGENPDEVSELSGQLEEEGEIEEGEEMTTTSKASDTELIKELRETLK